MYGCLRQTDRQTKPGLLRKAWAGFTLAELLVSLLILGEIATFTIPKILTAQQNGRNNAAAKEVATMLAEGFQQYSFYNTVSASTKAADIVPYLNYLSVDTTSIIDTNSATWSCGDWWAKCYRLHNGGILFIPDPLSFGGTSNTRNLYFVFDPDGQVSTVKGVLFYVFYNGRLSSWARTAGINTCNSANCTTANGTEDPNWFSW